MAGAASNQERLILGRVLYFRYSKNQRKGGSQHQQPYQNLVLSYFLGQQFLAWAFSDQNEGDNQDEDIKTRKQRILVERTKALRVLNIKPSTFHSLHSAGKTKKLQKILEQSLLLRTKDAQERTQEEMKEDFNINFEANMFSSLSMLLLNHKKLGIKSLLSTKGQKRNRAARKKNLFTPMAEL